MGRQPKNLEGQKGGVPPWLWHPLPCPKSHLGLHLGRTTGGSEDWGAAPFTWSTFLHPENLCTPQWRPPEPATFLVWSNGCFRTHARTPRGRLLTRSSLVGVLLGGLSLCAQASPWLSQHCSPRLSGAKRSEKPRRRGCQASPRSTHMGHMGVTSQFLAL